jgi:hypothetical protein
MVEKFVGREQWGAFLRVVEQAHEKDGTLSPGGASRMVRVSRQRVYQVVDTHESVRAWAFYEDSRKRQAEVYEVCVRDLVRWAVSMGHIRSPEDIGLPFPRIMQIYEEVCSEVLQTAIPTDTL